MSWKVTDVKDQSALYTHSSLGTKIWNLLITIPQLWGVDKAEQVKEESLSSRECALKSPYFSML